MARTASMIGVLLALVATAPLRAQSLGTFRWQLRPFCNAVTVTVTQAGAIYTLDGFDDQCGAPQRAPLVGVATLNPDGTIGLGLHIVTVPGGRAVAVDARIDQASLGGSWTDSEGNTGTIVFTPTAGTFGEVRPIPAGGIAPAGSITGAQLAPGAVGAGQLAPGVIAVTVASFGTCPAGQYLRGIQANGTVLCEPIGTPPLSTTVDDPTNSVGFNTSVAIGSDGLPVISHRDQSAGALRVTHCSNVACTSATSSPVDDPANTVGAYTSIAIGTDGLPVISHRDATANALRVTHCNDVACSSATSTTVDDPANSVGAYTSIAIGGDGLPVISHFDDTVNALRVTHCSNVACTSAISTTVDDPANSVGEFSSIAIGGDGLPIISHQDSTAGALRVTHCSNVACTSATSTPVDDPANTVGAYTSIAVGTDGFPVISHQDVVAGVLRVTHCGNSTCTSGNTSTTVDDIANVVGYYTSLAIGTDGLPVIGHSDGNALSLRVTHCSNAVCTSATSTIADDPGNFVGFFTSLAIGTDGLPFISHQDGTAGALRVTKCASRTCQ